MRLLYVGKDKEFSSLIKRLATKNSYKFSNADFSEQFFARLSKKEVHVLVIECDDVDGCLCEELITALKASSFSFLPIIAVGSSNDFEIRAKYFELGVMNYFYKDQFNKSRFEKHLKSIRSDYDSVETLKTLKIAVVDDSKFSIEMIKGFFEMNKVAHVDYYLDSSDFIKVKDTYDLYLIDFVMPRYDGEDLIYHIRERNDEAVIILITAYGNGKAIPHCLSIGADDFILKPLDYNLFMLRINACMNHFKANQENQVKSKALYELATKDPLTGAYNRAYFMDLFSKYAMDAMRSNKDFSIILLDLDHFKNVNDEYGHLKGDYVLKELTKILLEELRETDVVCRWGGEEFIILCSNTDLVNAALVAEKLRGKIESHHFKEVRRITASFGVTQWRNEDTDEIVFKRLDNSLYLAKLTGRNKVISNEEIQIIKSGIPVNIEWGPFFRSGNQGVDQEHHNLIVLSNEIIYYCFAKNNTEQVIHYFNRLIDEIVIHFKNEEEVLKKYQYDKFDEHKKIHDELATRSLSVQEALVAGEINPINVAKYLIQEVVVGHIIKADFDFFYIFENDYGMGYKENVSFS